jgi:hypothetical protein
MRCSQQPENMRPTAATGLTTFTPAASGVPTGVLHPLPVWAVLALLGVGVLLSSLQVIVTQVIRLRASARITRSQDALRVLEIEDLPRRRGRSSPPT